MVTYGTVEDGDTFFSNFLNGVAWKAATSEIKQQALNEATAWIETLNFVLEKADPNQPLEFPRTGQTEIPYDIEVACYFIADKLIDGVTPEGILESAGVVRRKVLEFETQYNPKFISPHAAAGIPSLSAWRHLLPYLRDASTVNVNRK